MAKRLSPEITEEQIAALRVRKVANSGATLYLRDITEILGPHFPIDIAVTRSLLPDDLEVEFSAMLTSQTLYLARVEDLIADFLDGLTAALQGSANRSNS